MDSLYKPEGVEERWQRTWEAEGHYNADPDPTRESFTIAHPPPNVTGDLHLGHALQLSLADTIVRTRRMQGYNVLFQPGYDHAGISTQNAVEKHLATQGKTRQELGREAFEALVWEWLREYGGKIMFQFRRIGASLDYRRERFTMDDALRPRRDALLRAPVPQGLDLPREPDHQLVPVPRDVALGSRGRARRGRRRAHVRPLSVRGRRRAHHDRDRAAGDDPRRRRRRRASRTTSAIATSSAGRSSCRSSSGACPSSRTSASSASSARARSRSRPGHDPLDYEIGRDHGLPELTVIGPDGRMNEEAGELAGLTQEEADERILAWLQRARAAGEARVATATRSRSATAARRGSSR